MTTIDAMLAEAEVVTVSNEVLLIDPNTRQINIPGNELVFGVEADGRAERKYFQCPRFVGNNIDLSTSFIRVNYRNGNGDIDFTLIEDVSVTADGENVTFSWELPSAATRYQGQVRFVVCAVSADLGHKWNTTQATGIVLAGMQPDSSVAEDATKDGIAQLLTTVEQQTQAVKDEGTAQIEAVRAASEAAEALSVAEIEAKGANTLESIPDDYTALSEAVDALDRSRAPGIVCSTEGETVNITDASSLKVQCIKIMGKSTQDGTPTPETPIDIVSVVEPKVTVRGKNLLSPGLSSKTVNGVTFTVNDDGSIVVNGTATQGAYFWCYGTGTQPTKQKFLPRGKYTISGMTTEISGFIIAAAIRESASADRVVVGYGNDVESASFEVKSDKALCDVLVSVSTGTTVNNVTIYPMLEVGDVATAYEPPGVVQTLALTHTLHGINTDSNGNYTDDNGQQWICDEVDFERGVFVQRMGVIESYTNEGVPGAYLSDTGELSQGAKVLYVLNTPIETPLSETEIAAYRALRTCYPNTTIINDSGAHVVVRYVADTKLYIDRILTQGGD